MSHTPAAPTPLTILTGFLGAGKTTLLNRILRGDTGRRIAVLVNDFGAINIDAQLIVSVEGESISLANGCICCTIRDDLLATVFGLMQRPEPPEYLVIEASGVSDPWVLAETFGRREMRRLIRLDGIITVVDAEQARDRPDAAELINDQIAAASLVLLNKVDLVSEATRAGLRRWIRAIVPQARIIETVHADAPLELLLDIGGDLATGAGLRAPRAPHDAQFETWSYESERPLRLEPLRRALAELPPEVFRAKGIVAIAESPDRRVVLQLAGTRISIAPAGEWGDAPRRTQIVLIGAPGALDAGELARRLDSCRAMGD